MKTFPFFQGLKYIIVSKISNKKKTSYFRQTALSSAVIIINTASSYYLGAQMLKKAN